MSSDSLRLRIRGRGLRLLSGALVGLAAAGGCADADAPAPATSPSVTATTLGRETTWVEIAGERFELELALDPTTRYRGLSGRAPIPRNGGMLFVNRRARMSSMVMRDCSVPIDLAFLDASGRVVAVHAMKTEPPRRNGETPSAYEGRLPSYPSGEPSVFAIETAGGRLAELDLTVGDRVILPARELAARAR